MLKVSSLDQMLQILLHNIEQQTPEYAGISRVPDLPKDFCEVDIPMRPSLHETPKRMLKAWDEMFAGYRVKPKSLFTTFDEVHDQMIVLRNVEFFSTCEHHFLPFHGVAHVGYIPNGSKVVGVSKLARLVDCFAKRLQIQERICNQVADTLVDFLDPLGAGCVISAKHLCIACRGVQKQHSEMISSALRGEFLEDPQARNEFYSLIKI